MVRNCYDICKDKLGEHYDFDGSGGGPGGNWQCLTADHYVTTSDNRYVSVADLSVGDKLSTGNVVVENSPKKSDVYWLRTTQGYFSVTKDHKVFLKSGGYKLVTELTEEDELIVDLASNEESLFNLTPDEWRFFGFWLGDGHCDYRHKNTKSPVVKVTLGTKRKEDYILNLDLELNHYTHTNKVTPIVSLVNKKHRGLNKLIHLCRGKYISDMFTAEEYSYIIEGYCQADGYVVDNSCTITSIDKRLLTVIQHGCHVNGWSASLSKRMDREATNFSDNPKPIWRLRVRKDLPPVSTFKSLVYKGKETVWVLNTTGDHSYFADNQLHHNCYDLANYVASFFGTRLVGPVAATIVYDNPQLYRLALVKTYDGQLETGDMIIFGPVGYNPAGHVAFYGHGDQTSATCIDQNHPAWNPVTEHTFNLLPLNPTHIVRFYNQEGYSAGGQSSGNQPGTISGNDTTKTKTRTYQFWEVTCDETEVLKEKDGEFIEKTFQCSKYTGLEDGDWIKIDRWDGSAGYIRKSCAKRREDLDVVVTTKKDASVTNDLPSGTANYDGGDISYGGYVLAKDKISAMASACAKYGIWLPGFICQTYLETNWGQSPGASYAGPENNWGGLTWTGNPQRESGVVVSQGAPRAEGGYYMKFASLKDYFEDHCNLISDRIGGADALYHANNKYDIESFTRGLFRPVAKYDYAAVGLGAYIAQMSSIYNGMKPQLDEVMGHIKEGEPLPTAPAVTKPTLPKFEVPKPKLPPLKTGNKATDRRSRWI